MKKVIVILIVIAAAVAIFAVVAGQNDIAGSAEKAESAVEQKVRPEELQKNVKFPIKTVKIPKLNIDKEKQKKKQKSKEENPDFNQKQKKCGE